MPTRLRKAATVAAAGALTLSACGSPHSAAVVSSSAMPHMTMPKTTPAAPTAAPVATSKVEIKSFAFAPAAVTVPVGTTVTWTNADQEAHTVTTPNGPLRSQPLTPGGTYSFRFTAAGTYSYLCTIHPFMTGTVVVTR